MCECIKSFLSEPHYSSFYIPPSPPSLSSQALSFSLTVEQLARRTASMLRAAEQPLCLAQINFLRANGSSDRPLALHLSHTHTGERPDIFFRFFAAPENVDLYCRK